MRKQILVHISQSLFVFCILQILITPSLLAKSWMIKDANTHSYSIQMCDNVTDGGAISGNETGTADPFFDPSLIINAQTPSGGTGDLEFLWIKTTDSPDEPFVVWTPIANSNVLQYDPTPISQTTYYIRCARRTACDDFVAESNIVTKMLVVPDCDNVLTGGSIGFDQTACGPEYDPTPFSNVLEPSGGSGDLEYLWFQSTVGPPYFVDSPDWFEIPNSNTAALDAPPITQTTWYIRCARRAACEAYLGKSNIVEVSIIDNVTDGGLIATNQMGCAPSFDPENITNLVGSSGTSADLEYLWFQSTIGPPYTSNSPNWTEVPNSNTSEYDPAAISETTWFIRCSRAVGCDTYTGESNVVKMMIFEAPNLQASITSQVLCGEGGAIDLSISEGLAPYTISWDNGIGNVEDPSNLAAGTYTVMVTDANGCQKTLSISLEDMGNSMNLTLTPTDVLCFGEATGTIALDIEGGAPEYTYQWSDPTMQTTANASNLTFGTYSVTVTDAEGCTATASATINGPTALTATMMTTDIACFGESNGSIWLDVSGGMPEYTYQWNDANNSTTASLIDVAAGIYSVEITDMNGCSITLSDTIMAPIEGIDLTTTGSTINCGDTAGMVTVAVTGALDYTILWNDANASTTETVENLPAGEYSVTVTTGECQEIATTTIQSIGIITLTTSSTEASCGENNGTASVSVTGATNYTVLWDDANNSTTETLENLPTGEYSVTVTAGECIETATVLVNTSGNLTLITTTTPEICPNSSSGTASVEIVGANAPFTVLWNDENAQNSTTAIDLAAGIYSLTVTDADGCTTMTNVEVEGLPGLDIDISGTDVSCNGGADGQAHIDVINGNAIYDVEWSTGVFNQDTISNLSPGIYSVTVIDESHCAAASSITISEAAAIELTISTTDATCAASADASASVVATGGTAPYSYVWSNAATTASLNNLTTGSYAVIVSDANGCSASANVSIYALSDLSAGITASNVNCFGDNDGSATVVGVNGLAPYTVLWNTGATDLTITNLSQGTYSATLTDAVGCSVEANTTISQSAPLTCAINLDSGINTPGATTGQLQATVAGGTPAYSYIWSHGSSNQTATNLGQGTYTLTVTDANGCTCQSSQTLLDPAKIGDYAWMDINENGLQDTNEPGLQNVFVTLTGTDNEANNISQTTLTDNTGMYMFVVPAGEYKVTFDLPMNFAFSQANNGINEALDSDADPITGMTEFVSLNAGDIYSDLDAGFIVLETVINIGNYVWLDYNRNGIQDVWEEGIENIMVKLINASTNMIVATQVTNSQGFYLFEDVQTGDYLIEFMTSSFPDDYLLTLQNEGTNNQVDSDADPITGRTETFDVVLGQTDDLAWDAGLYPACQNILYGGEIEGDQVVCAGDDLLEILNITLPSGGNSDIEYLWLQSNIAQYSGNGDPNWSIIPNSNTATYTPGPIGQTTYYIRCSRRAGCDDYTGESNIAIVEVNEAPPAIITEQPNNDICENELAAFEAMQGGVGASYLWHFGANATPATATTRMVNNVSWSILGTKEITLEVTRNGCIASTTTSLIVEDCTFGLMVFDDFTVTPMHEKTVDLTWTTSTDDSDTYFLVDRSDNGQDFETIELLQANDAIGQKTYLYNDARPLLGESYYRVRQVNSNGNTNSTASEMAIIMPIGTPDVRLYPNPVTDFVTLDVLLPQEKPMEIQLISPQGQVMLTRHIPATTRNISFDMRDLPTGIYFVEVTYNGHRSIVERIILSE